MSIVPTSRYGIPKPDGDEPWSHGDEQMDDAFDVIDLLLTPHTAGPATSRPASSSGSPSNKPGRTYRSTDAGGLVELDTGSAWIPVNGGLVYAGGSGQLYTIAAQAVGTPELADKAATYDKVGDPLFKRVSGTSYTVDVTDRNKVLVFTSATPVAALIPAGLAAPMEFACIQEGAGQVTWSIAAGGSLLNRPMKFKLAGQNAYATFMSRVTDTWFMLGDVA